MGKVYSEKLRLTQTILTIILILVLFGGAFKYFYLPEGRVVSGLHVLGVNIGGLTEAEAFERVLKLSDAYIKKPITLKLEDKEVIVDLKELKASLDTKEIINKAMKYGRRGNLFNRLKERDKISRQGLNLVPKVAYDRKSLRKKLEGIARDFDAKPLNARLIFTDNEGLKIIPEKPGRKTQISKTIIAFDKKTLEKRNREVAIVYQVIVPELTEAELKQLNMKEILTEFSTNFDQTNANRTHNIKVAAEAINGHVIFPGEVFSFNEVVGLRTQENDYKESLIIVEGEFVPGTGGGVCQVSSTLYNVVLLSNLEIVERQNHSRPVGYLPLGLDATVLDDRLDLKFSNTKSYPIMVNAAVNGGILRIRFFGAEKLKETIRVYTTDVEEIQPNVKEKEEPGLPKGSEVSEEGKPGYKLVVWREIIKEGQTVKKEKVSQDTYKAVDTILYKGTGEAPIFEYEYDRLVPN